MKTNESLSKKIAIAREGEYLGFCAGLKRKPTQRNYIHNNYPIKRTEYINSTKRSENYGQKKSVIPNYTVIGQKILF